MPIWVVTEILDFGALQNLYSLAPIELRKMVANQYRCRADELESWMNTIRILRNTCGHHARLWNRSISRPTTRFRKNDPIFEGCLRESHKTFSTFSILAYLLRQQEHHKQIRTIASVLKRFPEQVPQCSITDTGAPANWQSLPMWRKYT